MRHATGLILGLTVMFCMSGCSDKTDKPPGANNASAPAPDGTKEKSAQGDSLSPEETLARLAELARAGDWETYVDDFYGESHKFKGMPNRRDALVARFRNQWAEKVVAGFKPLEGKAAEMVEDGKKAVFTVDDEPVFSLYLSDDGRWTFHL